jgi:hypothetical protein
VASRPFSRVHLLCCVTQHVTYCDEPQLLGNKRVRVIFWHGWGQPATTLFPCPSDPLSDPMKQRPSIRHYSLHGV